MSSELTVEGKLGKGAADIAIAMTRRQRRKNMAPVEITNHRNDCDGGVRL